MTLLLSLPACNLTADDEGARTDGAQWDSAGVRFVAATDTGRWTAENRWTVERDLVIGTTSGPPEYRFANAKGVDADEDGNIYVLDQAAGRISVYSPAGDHLYSFGRAGQGPGEFSTSSPFGVEGLIVAEGEVFVADRSNDRGSRFTLTGDFIDTFSLGGAEGDARQVGVLPSGGYLLQRASMAWSGLLRLDSTGAVADTFLRFEGPRPTVGSDGRRVALPHSVIWTIGRDGTLLNGISDRFRIEVRDSTARLETVITRPEAPDLSEAERRRFLDELLERWAAMFRDRGESEEWIATQLSRGDDTFALPEKLPAFTGLAMGAEGTIWIQEVLPVDSMMREIVWSPTPISAFEAPEWQVFSAQGEFLGRISLPPRFTLYSIRNYNIYGVEHDDLGVQRVVRLRIEAPGES